MRQITRPIQYLRQFENRFVSNENCFIELEWWDQCIDANARPLLTDKAMPVWVGVDASVKRDTTAIVAVTWDATAKKVRLITHKVFQPSPDDPLDFEATIEQTLRDLCKRFAVRAVYFDPYQMMATAQRLTGTGVPMHEYPQTPANLTAMGSNLYELIKGGNLIVSPDDALRLAISRAVAKETPRGFQITKEKSSDKIDVVIALAMASLAAVEGGQSIGMSAIPLHVWERVLDDVSRYRYEPPPFRESPTPRF
jgi:phage terminase large subunit-like protein